MKETDNANYSRKEQDHTEYTDTIDLNFYIRQLPAGLINAL